MGSFDVDWSIPWIFIFFGQGRILQRIEGDSDNFSKFAIRVVMTNIFPLICIGIILTPFFYFVLNVPLTFV